MTLLMTTTEPSTNELSTGRWAYTIKKTRYGLYTGVFADGTEGTTALTEEACDFVMRNIRIPVLRGEWDGDTKVMGSAIVGGKL